jgi:hypothetical protein
MLKTQIKVTINDKKILKFRWLKSRKTVQYSRN